MLEKEIEIESAYEWQVNMQLLITERKWVDFVIYNPNFKQSLLIKRLYPDVSMQTKIKEGLKIGEKMIVEIEKKVKNI